MTGSESRCASQGMMDRQHKRKFMGPAVREYADELRHEMLKRRLQHSPIDWSRE
jgi:hypothetical protein